MDCDLEVGFFSGDFIRLNESENLARGVESIDLRSDFTAMLTQKAQQILQVQNVFLFEAL